MAQLAAQDVKVVAGEDHAVGVRKDLYVDTEQGVALEVENVAVAVDLGDGRVGMAQHVNATAVDLEQPQQQGYPYPQAGQAPYYPPPTANPYYNTAAPAPPPYYPQQSVPAPIHSPPPMITQNQDVKVVVQQEPARVVHVHNQGTSNYGSGAMILAVMATFCILFFGCWWSLICTFAAIFLAASATSAGARGDLSSAKTNNNASFGCTACAIVSTVIGMAILFGVAFSSSASSSSSSY